jgi:hypothetical protein
MAWRVLLTALNRIENSDGQAHIIDPKAISKDDLYGFMDQNTRKNYFRRKDRFKNDLFCFWNKQENGVMVYLLIFFGK